jgi:hypothetical protein
MEEQNNKLKDQEEVIEKLQRMVNEQAEVIKTCLWGVPPEHWCRVQLTLAFLVVKVCELKDKMEAQEKKLKARERKLKGHEYRVGKRYNTRSGKN